MGNEGKLDKRQVGLRIPLEICHKVQKGYSLPTDADATSAFIRALDEATKDIELTSADMDIIKAEIAANEAKRMAKRKMK